MSTFAHDGLHGEGERIGIEPMFVFGDYLSELDERDHASQCQNLAIQDRFQIVSQLSRRFASLWLGIF